MPSLEIVDLVSHFADALAELDATRPVGGAGRFKPGVGPLTETEVTAGVLSRLAVSAGAVYGGCGPRSYPNGRATCDLVIPNAWALELKLARPYGDNGKPAERWSENLLYPYPGNTSSIGDCLKLLGSSFSERKGIVVIGYEHSPPKIPLDPAVCSFELIARDVIGIELGVRAERLVPNLVHPVHQQARVFGWEVLGRRAPSA